MGIYNPVDTVFVVNSRLIRSLKLTLFHEVRLIWSAPRCKGIYLFYLNRYFPFFANIAYVAMEFADLQGTAYKAASAYHQVFILVIQVIVGVTLAMRTYALYACSRKMLVTIISITLITLAAGGYSLSPHGRIKNSGPDIGYAVAWEALLFFDLTMFSFLMYRTVLEARRRKKEPMQGSVPIFRLLIRDAIPFCYRIMFFASVANILTFYVNNTGFLSPMASSLSATMISRLSLNLRAHAEDILGGTDPYLSTIVQSGIQFAQSRSEGRRMEQIGTTGARSGVETTTSESAFTAHFSLGDIEVSEWRSPSESEIVEGFRA
ncbi:hypothetical protein DL96DRAFT_1584779 [Flagelloscypha sp. PMI_526]|nr:hypothetical protein DL96DRAFT_1584779 [Flagelloscypha sp. PMI_526]